MDVADLINKVGEQDFAKAGPIFAEIMKDKMASALDNEKIAVADQIFNNVEAEDEEEEIAAEVIDELDLDDEDDDYDYDIDEDDDDTSEV